MLDSQLTAKALRLLELKDDIRENLDWMIEHFDWARQNQEWGCESDKLKAAKELKEKIENI